MVTSGLWDIRYETSRHAQSARSSAPLHAGSRRCRGRFLCVCIPKCKRCFQPCQLECGGNAPIVCFFPAHSPLGAK